MFGSTRGGRDFSRELSEIDHLLRQLETRVGRMTQMGTRAAATGANQLVDSVSSVLGDISDRFRDRFRDSRFSASDAQKFGQDALQRVAREVEHRPLLTLAVAIGIGFLAGMAGRRN